MDKAITIRLSEDDLKECDRKCEEIGIDRSAYFRILIRSGKIVGRVEDGVKEADEKELKAISSPRKSTSLIKKGEIKVKKHMIEPIRKGYLEEAEKILKNPNNNPNFISFE